MKTTAVKICGVECEAPVWWVLWVDWLARCPRDLVSAHRLQMELGADPRDLSTTSDYWKARHS